MTPQNKFSTKHFFTLAASVVCCLIVLLSEPASAAIITHTPASGPNPVPVSAAFGPVSPGNTAGTRYIDFGVDYTNAVAVAAFNDPPLAFGGVNTSGDIDLLTPVIGRIVVLGSTAQGLTKSVTVTAGNASTNALLLEVFGTNNALLASQPNPTDGFSTWGITRASADIASFRVSTPVQDAFGVDEISIESPIGVPEPAISALMLGMGWIGLGFRRGVRRNSR